MIREKRKLRGGIEIEMIGKRRKLRKIEE